MLLILAGWLQRQKASAIAYLLEENRVLREQLASGGYASPVLLQDVRSLLDELRPASS